MTIFDGSLSVQNIDIEKLSVNIFPNPESDLTAIQVNDLVDLSIIIELFDAKGKLAQSKVIKPESMILYFDIQAPYSGIYFVNISSGNSSKLHKVIIAR
ncbi:T9SS type A sorting domain-containing protein [Brumimicrobium mesophilum]|uniref:T9SS type A sorting domain-containing protein n=1 Tax=Brumimicrobium mesophilum TaxID=392717 RepID=UPI00131EBC1E|nr:T9SS type A sorting domain-containing protein [Brumimicrobium mesophilum]